MVCKDCPRQGEPGHVLVRLVQLKLEAFRPITQRDTTLPCCHLANQQPDGALPGWKLTPSDADHPHLSVILATLKGRLCAHAPRSIQHELWSALQNTPEPGLLTSMTGSGGETNPTTRTGTMKASFMIFSNRDISNRAIGRTRSATA